MNQAPPLPPGIWQLDRTSTTVTVSAKKLGFFTIPATLDVVSGSIEIDDDHNVSKVEIVVDASTYASKNAKRNDHVRSADFLDAANHPTIAFATARVTPQGAGYVSKGTVTIKGQSSPIDVAISEVEVDGVTGSFTANAAIDRNAIGVDKLPGVIIGRTLHVSVDATATRSS